LVPEFVFHFKKNPPDVGTCGGCAFFLKKYADFISWIAGAELNFYCKETALWRDLPKTASKLFRAGLAAKNEWLFQRFR